MKILLLAFLVIMPSTLFADCINVSNCTKTGELVITCSCNDPVTVVIDMGDILNKIDIETSKLDKTNASIADLQKQLEVARQLGVDPKNPRR